MAVINDAAILAGGTNTPLSISIFILLPTGVTGLNMLLINLKKRLKYTTPYLKKFTDEDESIYLIFRGLFEAKLQTDV